MRAGILITGTEVLSGIISDRNGPWLSERLREHGIEVAEIVIVADRREDMLARAAVHGRASTSWSPAAASARPRTT